jgi:hypothetical protein
MKKMFFIHTVGSKEFALYKVLSLRFRLGTDKYRMKKTKKLLEGGDKG